jgi:7-carboxy-7-deazaguanine synthase
MLYPVNEIFESIQGEATWTGTPSVFLRLQGCDIGCPWCDTKASWMPASSPEAKALSLSEILAKTDAAATFAILTEKQIAAMLKTNFSARHIVLTGGEPCSHDLMPLAEELLCEGFGVQIETSGAYEIKAPDAAWVTLSPKIDMPGSAGPLINSLLRADEIKMPVGKIGDVLRLQSLLPHIRPGTSVWLQPLSQSEKATWVCIKAATKNGWRLSLQTHKFIGVR